MTVPYVFVTSTSSMASATGVIHRAMRRLKVLAGEETLTAAELSDSLVTMNSVMHGFGPKGIHYAHADLAATDTVNMPDELIDCLVWMIAEALAVEYGYEFKPLEHAAILDARNMLQAAYWVQPPAATDPLLRPRRYSTDITRGQ